LRLQFGRRGRKARGVYADLEVLVVLSVIGTRSNYCSRRWGEAGPRCACPLHQHLQATGPWRRRCIGTNNEGLTFRYSGRGAEWGRHLLVRLAGARATRASRASIPDGASSRTWRAWRGMCPALNPAGAFKLKAIGAGLWIWLNLQLSAPLSDRRSTAAVVASAQTALLADARSGKHAPATGFRGPPVSGVYYINTNEPTSTSSQEKLQVCFLRSPYCAEKPVAGSIDSSVARATIGRVGNEILIVP